MVKLRIEINSVNTALADLRRQLNRLDMVENRLLSGLGKGWESSNAAKVNEKLKAFHDSVGKIRTSIDSIENAVSQYKTNVTEVDSNTARFEE